MTEHLAGPYAFERIHSPASDAVLSRDARIRTERARSFFFELNGQPREDTIRDDALRATVQARPETDAGKPGQVGVPILGAISSVAVEVGRQAKKGERLLDLEAMKM